MGPGKKPQRCLLSITVHVAIRLRIGWEVNDAECLTTALLGNPSLVLKRVLIRRGLQMGRSVSCSADPSSAVLQNPVETRLD